MKYVIFDFDGTIADSMPLVADIARIILPKTDLSPAQIEKLRNMPPRQIIKYSGISYIKIPHMLLRGKRILSKRLDEIRAVQGIVPVIQALYEQGYTLFVVSSNSETNIRLFLDKYRMKHYFRAIYGNVGLFSKAQTLKKVMKWQKIDGAESCLYIGDEVRDIEAAKKVHIKIAAVTWGFNGMTILKKYKPDYLVSKPKQLLEIVGTHETA